MPENKDNLVTVLFICPLCGKEHTLEHFPESLFDRVANRRQTGEHIQDILKDYSANDREKFQSGYCDECQEEIFGPSEED